MQNKATKMEINPKICLKKANPIEVIRDYRSGKYNDIDIESKRDKLRLIKGDVNMKERVGTSPDSDIYKYSDRENNSQIVYTTSSIPYNCMLNKVSMSIDNVLCLWCSDKVKDLETGITLQKEGEKRHTLVPFCSYECAYSYLKEQRRLPITQRDSIFDQSEMLMNELFSKLYPGETLKPAPERGLHKNFLGPLSSEEFHSKKHIFIRQGGFISLPTKREYLVAATLVGK